ncbi:hypothetical protein MRX96_028750 [Rhipicephalus microplus]
MSFNERQSLLNETDNLYFSSWIYCVVTAQRPKVIQSAARLCESLRRTAVLKSIHSARAVLFQLRRERVCLLSVPRHLKEAVSSVRRKPCSDQQKANKRADSEVKEQHQKKRGGSSGKAVLRECCARTNAHTGGAGHPPPPEKRRRCRQLNTSPLTGRECSRRRRVPSSRRR